MGLVARTRDIRREPHSLATRAPVRRSCGRHRYVACNGRASSRRGDASNRLAAHYANLADLEEVAVRERRELAGLEHRLGDASVAHVPELGHDVHDFAALRAVGKHLLGAD